TVRDRHARSFRGVFSWTSSGSNGGLDEAVRVDVDADSQAGRKGEGAEPLANYVLQLGGAAGIDQQPVAVPAPQQRQRRRGRAEYGNVGMAWPGAADRASGVAGFRFVL